MGNKSMKAAIVSATPSSVASSTAMTPIATPTAFKPAATVVPAAAAATVPTPPVAVTIHAGGNAASGTSTGKWSTSKKFILGVTIILTVWYIYKKRHAIRQWIRNKNAKSRKRKFEVIDTDKIHRSSIQKVHFDENGAMHAVEEPHDDDDDSEGAHEQQPYEEEEDLTEEEKAKLQQHVDQVCGDILERGQSSYIIFGGSTAAVEVNQGQEDNSLGGGQITELHEEEGEGIDEEARQNEEGEDGEILPYPLPSIAHEEEDDNQQLQTSPEVSFSPVSFEPAPSSASSSSKLFGKRSKRKSQ